ncbi:uncharacterized protein FOMMEDRAFT_153777 [Fomitiporia mediterranea MF3/22]|uniref:uncharacterized protein n=1 Tax=Fomitiporia mediterranea (strain MF3/22) TaxID=694068 RepID=UPI0004408D9C|nr:uncharacterized protein FOMMEDRAFT_153777 [Fomitiporia mediterranea MF3/22]EJD04705.1 hypothetical protein FOMMEDRAFT_153777 [Fomitiporia mediterranea MF3/22]
MATAYLIRNGVMDSTEECKCVWGKCVKSDVKQGLYEGVEHYARVCSSIVACAAEQEEEREYMELLKKSFSIGQQCGSANANAKRKRNVKKRRITKERQRKQQNEEQKGWKGDKKLGGEG